MRISNLITPSLISKALFLLVLTTLSSCNDDESDKTTGALIITFDTSGYDMATMNDCLSLGNSSSTCESFYAVGKIRVVIYAASGIELFDDNVEANKPVNFGEFNAGDYEIDADFFILESGDMQKYYADFFSFQIIAGDDKNITISNWEKD